MTFETENSLRSSTTFMDKIETGSAKVLSRKRLRPGLGKRLCGKNSLQKIMKLIAD